MALNWINKNIAHVFCNDSNVAPEPVVLPEDVLQSLRAGRAYPLAKFMDWLCAQQNSKAIFDELWREANECGWLESELKKLVTYHDYFSQRFREAFEQCEPFIRGQEIDLDYFGIASMALFNTNQFGRAYRLLKRVKSHEIALQHDSDFLLAAALISWAAGDRYRANRYIDKGFDLELEPGIATFNALAMYFEMGDEEGIRRSREALNEQAMQHPNFVYAIAFIELAQNNYTKGLKLAEARYQMSEAHRYMRIELFTQQRWDREEISEKTLLIHGEQGLGDMIQTARFFDHCQNAAKKVIVECPNESIALLQYNFPNIEFLPLSKESPTQCYDIWVGTLSLPYIFQIAHDSIPGRAGYLVVPPDHRQYWRGRVNEIGRPNRVRIGLAWSGHPGHRADHRRSIFWPNVKALVEQFPEIDFFAVQTRLPDNLPSHLHDCADELITLSDTAALIEQMDLIISVDTSVVHIAGAIGKETWMMLPYRYEWRWGLEGEDSNWYDSVKVIRQPAPGAWAPVLSRVFGRRLRNFLSSKVHSQ